MLNFGRYRPPYAVERYNREQRQKHVEDLRERVRIACPSGTLAVDANYAHGWLRAGFRTHVDPMFLRLVEVDEFGAFTDMEFKAFEEECIKVFMSGPRDV